jgi:hypothetical protein
VISSCALLWTFSSRELQTSLLLGTGTNSIRLDPLHTQPQYSPPQLCGLNIIIRAFIIEAWAFQFLITYFFKKGNIFQLCSRYKCIKAVNNFILRSRLDSWNMIQFWIWNLFRRI